MWRQTTTIFKKAILPSLKERYIPKRWYSARGRQPSSTARVALTSVGVGVLVGAAYGGYTHYKVNVNKTRTPPSEQKYLFLKTAPEYKAQYKVVNKRDTSDLSLVLFQYTSCPFCCKVRAFLDYHGFSYEVVEVDAVLRQALGWSAYKKVPILLAKVEGGYQQLLDSTAIISVLATYLRVGSGELSEVLQYYPASISVDGAGKELVEIPNKYFVMHNGPVSPEQAKADLEEREWRRWADEVLVKLLSPNVYRSPAEALHTFRAFSAAGRWREQFPAWECALMEYGGALAMWAVSRRLAARRGLGADVRAPLYAAAREWAAARGRAAPHCASLADLAVWGALASIRDTAAFRDLRDHSDIGPWFDGIETDLASKAVRVRLSRYENNV